MKDKHDKYISQVKLKKRNEIYSNKICGLKSNVYIYYIVDAIHFERGMDSSQSQQLYRQHLYCPNTTASRQFFLENIKSNKFRM